LKRDISLASFTSEKFDDADGIFHLACHPRSLSIDNPQRDVEVNVKGMVNVLEIAKRNKCKVVYTSNSGIYGEPEYIPIDEKHPDKPLTPYDVDKLSAEYHLKSYNKLFEVPHVICRLATVYGERQGHSEGWKPVVVEFIKRIKKRERPIIYGSGKQTRDFVYVKDVANALATAMYSDIENETMIISTNKETAIIDLYNYLRELMHENDLDPVYEPEKKGDIMRMRYNNSKAKRLLNWHPHELRECLKNTIEKGEF